MPAVFADTSYLVALLSPPDGLHRKAVLLTKELAGNAFITTDFVLVELLAFFAERGAHLRTNATAAVDIWRSDPVRSSIRLTTDLFDRGLSLYRARPDKGYSLTDCISMVVCQDEGITDVLTHDGHFRQEGFTTLL